jgi:hypothetical protein
VTRTKKQWPCFICEKLYAECEEAEVCERSHANDLDQGERHRDEDDGRTYDDPRDELDRRRERDDDC